MAEWKNSFDALAGTGTLKEVAKTAKRYNKDAAAKIADWFGMVALADSDKDKILKMAKILSLNEVVRGANIYRGA